MNEKVIVTSMVNGRIGLVLPHMHINKVFPKKEKPEMTQAPLYTAPNAAASAALPGAGGKPANRFVPKRRKKSTKKFRISRISR